jgi:hypothetical protein
MFALHKFNSKKPNAYISLPHPHSNPCKNA